MKEGVLDRRLLTTAAAVGLALALVASAALATTVPQEPTSAPEEQQYRTIVVFRNDDVQPYYRTETMRAVDRIFIEEGVPVTQAVIPMVGGRPATESDEFCRYLTRLGDDHPDLFEFALHGYTHAEETAFHGKSEFGGLPADTQREYIREGTDVLTECTGRTPTTFVPPFNTYDDATTDALAAEGYTAISSADWFTRERYDRTGPFVGEHLQHVPSTRGFVGNWTTNEFAPQDRLNRSFDRAYENGSVYVQMLHYPTFDTEEKRDRLRSFVRYVKGHDDVGFMTLGEFAEARAEGRLERTDRGWNYRPEPDRPRGRLDRLLCALDDRRCALKPLSLSPDAASALGGIRPAVERRVPNTVIER